MKQHNINKCPPYQPMQIECAMSATGFSTRGYANAYASGILGF
ncbi:MAG: hypothetical protein RMY34_01640 [Aulosira sp. DedQUE10]|nr:hypothetical protein [Aulosira sp. DedQUE10]